eukprot:49283-Eustigmatos_ZCMA.PRE.1
MFTIASGVTGGGRDPRRPSHLRDGDTRPWSDAHGQEKCHREEAPLGGSTRMCDGGVCGQDGHTDAESDDCQG